LSDDVAVTFGANTDGFVAGVDQVKEKVEGLRAPFDALQNRVGGALDRNVGGIVHTAECVNQLTLDLKTLGTDGFAALKPLIDFCVYALDGFAQELDRAVCDTGTDIQNILKLGQALNKFVNWASFGAVPMGSWDQDAPTAPTARGGRNQVIGTDEPGGGRIGKGTDEDRAIESDLDREIIEETQQRIAALEAEQRASDIDFESQIRHLDALRREGKLTADDALRQEQLLNVQKWSSDENYLQQQLDLYEGNAAGKQRIQGEELVQTASFNATMVALADRAATETQQSWKQALTELSDQFAKYATDVIIRTKSIGAAFDEMVRSLLSDALQSVFKGLFNAVLFGSSGGAGRSDGSGLFGELGGDVIKGLVGTSPGALLGGLPIAGGAASGGLLASLFGGGGFGNTDTDFSDAAGGAIFSSLFSALSSPLKFLGGLLGFEAGGIAPSAAGGWVVPHFANGGILSMLHQNEMVLPAPISQGLQSMIATGGVPGGHTINISAIDGASVARLFRNNGSALVAALNGAMRNGSFLAQPS
jgi:hypothetical protein